MPVPTMHQINAAERLKKPEILHRVQDNIKLWSEFDKSDPHTADRVAAHYRSGFAGTEGSNKDIAHYEGEFAVETEVIQSAESRKIERQYKRFYNMKRP